MGDPVDISPESAPSPQELTETTHITFADMDSSPTKAWLVGQRNDPAWKQHYEWAFAKRPREELYILADDPDQVKNVAQNSNYEVIRAKLEAQLMAELKRTNDPRVENEGAFFESPPMAGPLPADAFQPKRNKKKK